MHAQIKVIAKISCYFRAVPQYNRVLYCGSVVTVKLHKEYLNTVIYNTSVLLCIKS